MWIIDFLRILWFAKEKASTMYIWTGSTLLRVRKYAKFVIFYTEIYEVTPLRLWRESLWLQKFWLQISFLLTFFKTNTINIKCKHCKPVVNDLNWRINYVCLLKCVLLSFNIYDDHHHGFEPLLVSRLSYEAVATSCFLHDSVNMQDVQKWHTRRKEIDL